MRTRVGTIAATLAALAAALAAACASRPASPPPTAPPAPATPSPAPPPAAPAPASRFALLPGPAAYDVRTEATIEMTAGPDAERGRETVTTTARVGYDVTAAGRGATVVGQVDGLAVEASSRVAGGAPLPPGPVRFRGTLDARGARLSPDAPALGCLTPAGSAQAAALAAARESAVWAPASIAVGTRWRDSVTVTTCRGPVAAATTIAARYEVTAIDGTRVRVRRETTVSLRGGGIVAGRNVTLVGGGTGTATLELDAARGRLSRVDGDVRTTITLTLPDGARQFTQQLRTRVATRGA